MKACFVDRFLGACFLVKACFVDRFLGECFLVKACFVDRFLDLEVGGLIALLGLNFYRMVVFGLARSEIIHL